jgi:L-ribulokinase
VLNQVYANVLGRPVLVPRSKVTGIGAAIFAFLAAGTFRTIDDAQQHVCPGHTTFTPEAGQRRTYDELYFLYRRLYFGFGQPAKSDTFGDVLPKLIQIARPEPVA